MDNLIIANQNGKRQAFIRGSFKEVDKFLKDMLAENPTANVSVLLDKLEPETVATHAREVN